MTIWPRCIMVQRMRCSVATIPLFLVVSIAGCQAPAFEFAPQADEWVLGVLPDTQYYSARCPEVFDAQTAWFAEHREELGLDFIVHLGDLTDDGNEPQWQVASDAMATLDGVVPYSVLPGNHDIGVDGDASTRDGEIDMWFPPSRFSSALVETFPEGSISNSFHRFTTRTGVEQCVLALEFGPRIPTVDWARALLEANAGCETVLTTHAYLHDNGERYSSRDQPFHPDSYGIGQSEEVFDGEDLYEALVVPYSQVRMVLSGHALNGGAARRLDERADGTAALQILSNYQERGDCGGDGFLRVMAISPTGVRVRSYSPTLDATLSDDAHEFDVRWP